MWNIVCPWGTRDTIIFFFFRFLQYDARVGWFETDEHKLSGNLEDINSLITLVWTEVWRCEGHGTNPGPFLSTFYGVDICSFLWIQILSVRRFFRHKHWCNLRGLSRCNSLFGVGFIDNGLWYFFDETFLIYGTFILVIWR